MQRKLISFFLLSSLAIAAVPATAVYEVRPTNGVDTNGGAFIPGSSGTDYSQQNAAQYALTGLTTAAANAIILSASASADMVGNLIQITGGTNFTTGQYQIVSVSVGVSITVDRNVTSAAGAAGTGNIGGALKTLGKVCGIFAAANQNATGQTAWVKAEATITTGAQITCSPNGGSSNNQATQINGYTTSRGDSGQVTIQANAGSAFTLLFMQVTGPVIIRNFILDGNSRTTLQCGQFLGAYVQVENFKATNCPNGGFLFNNTNNSCWRCLSTGNGAYGFSMEQGNGPNFATDSVAVNNTGTGFFGAVFSCTRCLSGNNTGVSSDGFGGTNGLGKNSTYAVLDHCIAYANGRDGFFFGTAITARVLFLNNIAWGNTTTDVLFGTAVTSGGITGDYNAYATSSGYPVGAHDVTLSVDPTVAGASNNFALNNTTGGGAAIRAKAFPGVLATGGTGFADLGPLQSQAASAAVAIGFVQ